MAELAPSPFDLDFCFTHMVELMFMYFLKLSYEKFCLPLFNKVLICDIEYFHIRLLARGSIAPPLGNFADIPYLKEQFKLSRIRDVCTLSVGALSCNSLLHTLPKQN